MINVSQEFENLMKYSTDFREYAEVTLADGTVFTLDDNNFTASNNNIIDGGGGNSFPLGVAVQKVLQIEILNEHKKYKNYIFTGAKIRLYLTYKLSNTTERVEKGVYTVVTPETYGETIIITAYDDMYKADKTYFTGLVFPQTAGAVLQDACDNCGILLYDSDFLHNDFVIREKPEGTFRTVIGHIAMIACGNARIDRTGYLKILTYDLGSESVAVLEDFSNLKYESEDTLITGVKMIIEDEEEQEILTGTNEYVLTLTNPLVSGSEQTLLSWVYERVANIPFRPFNGDHISQPLIEFMDLVEIRDRGNVYNSFITDVNFVFAGITTVKNVSPGTIRQNGKYSSGNTKTEQFAKDLVKKERTAREEAVKKLNENIANASGMHITEVQQEDGSKVIYMHDKPTLKESKNVMVITSDAVGFSTDGGKTYPFGFRIDGDMIANILYTNGVNAGWIDTGALVIKDDNGNVVFSADIDTGKVSISGDSVFIGDSTIPQEIQKSKNLNIVMSNEYQSIPVDPDGNYEVFPECSTTVSVFYGSEDVTGACSYNISNSDNVTGTWDLSKKKYSVTGLYADSGWVDITATYTGVFAVTKRFNIAKLYAGATGKDGISYRIDSSAGIAFAEGTSETTTLTARVYFGPDEYDQNGYYSYSWYKVDNSGNENYLGSGKRIIVSSDNISGYGIYFILDDSNVSDGPEMALRDSNGLILKDVNGYYLLPKGGE